MNNRSLLSAFQNNIDVVNMNRVETISEMSDGRGADLGSSGYCTHDFRNLKMLSVLNSDFVSSRNQITNGWVWICAFGTIDLRNRQLGMRKILLQLIIFLPLSRVCSRNNFLFFHRATNTGIV